jgi:branched-chain amino acid transport system substrate-binding protein
MRRQVVAIVLLMVALAACAAPSPTGETTGGGGGGESPAASEPTVAASDQASAGAELSGDPIPIGVAVAQTGNVALLGQEQVIGAEIAEQFFNDRGGVNGRPIDVILQDAQGDEAGAINAFQTLINSNQVVGIVGPTLSQQAFASDPIAEQAGVPVLGPSNTAQGIPEIGDYIARVSAPVAVVAPNAVEVALEQDPNIQTVSVAFAQNDAFSTSETQTFQQAVTERGLTLAPVQTFQTTDTDFTSQATTIIGQNPQLVIISGLAADGGNLVRQLRELGYTGLIVGGNGLNTANIFPVCAELCDGIIIAQAYSPEYESDVNAEFIEAYTERQDRNPPQFSAQAFAGVQVFVEALAALDDEQGLDSLELPELRTALNEQILAGEYDTPLGPISFTEEGEVNQETFYVAQINMEDAQTGTFEFVR